MAIPACTGDCVVGSCVGLIFWPLVDSTWLLELLVFVGLNLPKSDRSLFGMKELLIVELLTLLIALVAPLLVAGRFSVALAAICCNRSSLIVLGLAVVVVVVVVVVDVDEVDVALEADVDVEGNCAVEVGIRLVGVVDLFSSARADVTVVDSAEVPESLVELAAPVVEVVDVTVVGVVSVAPVVDELDPPGPTLVIGICVVLMEKELVICWLGRVSVLLPPEESIMVGCDASTTMDLVVAELLDSLISLPPA